MRTALIGFVLFSLVPSLFAQSGKTLRESPIFPDSASVIAMVELSGKFLDSGSMLESMTLLRRAQSKADSLNSSYLIQLVNASLAESFLTADQPDSAAIILQETLNRFPNSQRKVDLLNLLGTAYRYQANYRKALQTYAEAKALVDSTEKPRSLAVINQNMAVAYGSIGNKGAALKFYLKGVKYGEAAKDSLFLATVFNNLGELYNHYSQSEKAEFYLKRSMNISKETGFKVGAFRAASNLANTKKNLGQFEEALSLYKYALSLHRQIRPSRPPFRIIHNLGNMHLMMGNIDQAEENFNQSLEYSRKFEIPEGFYYNYSGLANVAEQRGELFEAIDYWQQAFSVAEEIGLLLFQKTSSENIYRLNKELGNFSEALSWHEEYKVIADSMQQLEAEQKLAETEALLNLRKQVQMNDLLQQKQQEQEARIRIQNWLIAAGAGIIFLTFLSLVLIYRAKQEKQRVNHELESQRNQLQQLNKVKDKILAIIAHDLRSPMASMQSMLYLLREDDLSREDVETMWAQLELSVSQNISMMDNLLAWAREQMSGMALNLQTIAASDIVEEVFKNYEYTARQKGVSLVNHVPKGLKVQADFNLLKLILRNLITNSIKFTKEGDRITVSTREESGKAIFEVNDTGIGIPKEDQQNLFSVYGESREGTNQEKGSGLGLQLCKEFVEKQDGEIAVKSIEGEGTTFSFSLPRAS